MRKQYLAHIKQLTERHHIVVPTHRVERILNKSPDHLGSQFPAGYSAQSKLRWCGGVAYVRIDRRAKNPQEKWYFGMLHEIAHLIHPPAKSTDVNKIDAEIAAWEWAFQNAKHFPSEATICDILDALFTYALQRLDVLNLVRYAKENDPRLFRLLQRAWRNMVRRKVRTSAK